MSVLVERPGSVRRGGSEMPGRRGVSPRRAHGSPVGGGATRRRAVRDAAPQTVRRVPRRVHGERTVHSIGDRPATRRGMAGPAGVGVAAACAVRPAARPMRVLVGIGVLSAMAVVVLAILGAFGSTTAVPDRTAVVQVQQGQTLTDLAAAAAPDGDQGAVVDRIEELNGLSSGVLHVGQALVVPVSSPAASTAAAK